MLTQENFSSVIDEVMHGAIDMQAHFGPDMPPAGDLGVARRLDGLGTARQARGPLTQAARAVGVQHCAMTVDGGQAFGPVPAEAFRAFVGQLLFHGMSPEEVKMMAQTVPARVLGLD
jgi:hypothetical protein